MRDREVWGIEPGYDSAAGEWCALSERTRAAFLATMGVGEQPEVAPGNSAPVAEDGPHATAGARAPIVLREADRTPLPAGELQLEDGGALRVGGPLPPHVPLGYHVLTPSDGGAPRQLILAPARCFLPEGLRTWGWSAQLYAVRSRHSWGLGDLEDLRRLASWSADLGAGVLMVNPLHADTPVSPQAASPYLPSSRLYKNPLYLHVETIPGAATATAELEPLAAAGRALNGARRIDRDAVLHLKLQALELLWSRFGGHPAFDRYCAEQGTALTSFATFCVLAERFGRDWHRWPGEYVRPESASVARFAADHDARLRFHAWMQWLLNAQMARAGVDLALMQDLPVGFDRDGADAWRWQDLLATDMNVGAPPDPFSTAGQDWGFPPFIPQRLRAAGYAPFVQTLRASLRHAGGLRIDHVMGLFRQFWVPQGAAATDGGYVRFPADDLLAIVALESQRARAFIVGEDLGTVGPGVRDVLQQQNILSYRLLWFESAAPPNYPKRALAAVTTHDLPTIAGVWNGAELRFAVAHQQESNATELRAMHARLRDSAGLLEDAPVDRVIEATYRTLAAAPSDIVMAALEDALEVEERPNMPGATSDAWPNWSLALPAPLEDFQTAPLALRIAAALSRRTISAPD